MAGFNKTNIDQAHTELEDVLAKWAEKYGAVANLGRLTYSPDKITVKLTALIPEPGTEDQAPWLTEIENNWRTHYLRKGLMGHSLGEGVKIAGHGPGKIVGLKPRSSKYPVVVQSDSTGKYFKVPVSRVTGRSY